MFIFWCSTHKQLGVFLTVRLLVSALSLCLLLCLLHIFSLGCMWEVVLCGSIGVDTFFCVACFHIFCFCILVSNILRCGFWFCRRILFGRLRRILLSRISHSCFHAHGDRAARARGFPLFVDIFLA